LLYIDIGKRLMKINNNKNPISQVVQFQILQFNEFENVENQLLKVEYQMNKKLTTQVKCGEFHPMKSAIKSTVQ
jgi:hypothetical protein